MSEHMLHTNIKSVLSELTVHSEKNYFMENKIRPNLCYTRKYDVFSPKCCYIRQCYIPESMLLTKILCLLSELTLHTIMCNVRKYLTHEHEM